MSILSELKRRNVFRVAIAYAVASWVLLQVADLFMGYVDAPDWVMHVLMFFMGLGFIAAMAVSWVYELTPEGIRREKDVQRGDSITAHTSRKLDRIIIAFLAVAVVVLLYRQSAMAPEDVVEPPTQAVPAETAQAAPSLNAGDQSIAVLPFINMSDDAGNEYFSEGLSEELLNLLVRIPELRVAARTSSFSYKGTNTKIGQIAKELNVTHVLEGSVRKSGNQLRITAQLVKADDGFHLWRETYDRTLENIFQIQDDIAAAVVDGLKITLMGTAVPESRDTEPEVYSLYLQGKYFQRLRGEENLEKAVSAFKQALVIDPDYAPAWVGISWAYEWQARSRFGSRTREQSVALAFQATERALAIDDSMATAWSQLAFMKKSYDWDWQGAKAAIEKALQLEPNNADVLGSAATLASSLGQLAKSIELFERAVALDPLSLASLIALGNRYRAAGRYDEALEKYRQVLALNPEYPWAPSGIALTYELQGNSELALAEINRISADSLGYDSIRVKILSSLGRELESQAITKEYLEKSARENPLAMAIIYTRVGDYDSAFEWLETAFEQREKSLNHILWQDAWTGLESDPRYPVFLEKLGLLEYWKEMPPDHRGPP